MNSRSLFLGALALCAAWAALAVEIQLPPETAVYKPSQLPGYQLVQRNCMTCHAAQYAATQPPGSNRAYWEATVKKMKKPYGAQFDDADIPAIVDYLVKTYGNERAGAPRGPAPLKKPGADAARVGRAKRRGRGMVNCNFPPTRLPMTPASPRLRILSLFSLSVLGGCAVFQGAPQPEAAFVVLGENGTPVVRAITNAASCPPLSVDGDQRQMTVRSPLHAIPARPGKPQPASAPVLACDATVPAGATEVRVAGRALPLPKAEARRIVVIGDTGCRIKGHEVQDCNNDKAFPFARIAAVAAAFSPDLVVHVGDFHYREDACPPGHAGCAGSPWGYGWDAWNADFFKPARPLLHAAPWVMVRGNHESCARAGQGWWRYLDPRPLQPRRDCDNPADDAVGDYSDPYAVPLGAGAQLIVFDSANTWYKGFAAGDPRRAIYADTLRKVAALSRNAAYNIAADHHPLFAFGATKNAKTGAITLFGGDKGLLQAFGDVEPDYLPKNISMLLSGHVHLWEQVSFSSGHPTQFVSGFSGTAEDIVPLPAAVPPGETPAPGAVVAHMSTWIDGFGFMTMERSGPQDWLVKVWDRDGRERNTCTVSGNTSACELSQVK